MIAEYITHRQILIEAFITPVSTFSANAKEGALLHPIFNLRIIFVSQGLHPIEASSQVKSPLE